jgi:hypothetical protein
MALPFLFPDADGSYGERQRLTEGQTPALGGGSKGGESFYKIILK